MSIKLNTAVNVTNPLSKLPPPAEFPADHRDLKLAIDYVPVGMLKGYDRNARTHSMKQIAQIGVDPCFRHGQPARRR